MTFQVSYFGGAATLGNNAAIGMVTVPSPEAFVGGQILGVGNEPRARRFHSTTVARRLALCETFPGERAPFPGNLIQRCQVASDAGAPGRRRDARPNAKETILD
jgi:hypothetical protein